jgi:hypothetical protein
MAWRRKFRSTNALKKSLPPPFKALEAPFLLMLPSINQQNPLLARCFGPVSVFDRSEQRYSDIYPVLSDPLPAST